MGEVKWLELCGLFLQERPACCLYVQLCVYAVGKYFDAKYYSLYSLCACVCVRVHLHARLVYIHSASPHDLAEYHVENP